MNDIEKLEERIAQLTELVNTGTETIESLKKTLKTVEEERDRLAKEQEPKFERVKEGEKYYYVNFSKYRRDGNWFVDSGTEDGYDWDKVRYDNNNYFHTKQRAQEVVDKLNFLLKLERLHDIYCPNYVPDWTDWSEKYKIYYSYYHKRYDYCVNSGDFYKETVYFPTSEIAKKVCDILNAELERKV